MMVLLQGGVIKRPLPEIRGWQTPSPGSAIFRPQTASGGRGISTLECTAAGSFGLTIVAHAIQDADNATLATMIIVSMGSVIMKTKLMMMVLAASSIVPMLGAAPAQAQHYYSDGYYDQYQRDAYQMADRGYDRRYYQRRPARYAQDCRPSSGTTGAIAGGAGGAVIGKLLGGDTLGTVLGALGGGLLGRQLDKQHDARQNYREGCY